jgi:hypothetical protein
LAKNWVLISSSSLMRSSKPCSSMFFAAISRSWAFFAVMSRLSAAMNTTVPWSSTTGMSEASMVIVTEPSALA